MWFMLDKIKEGPIKMVRRTPAGDEEFIQNGLNNASFFRMKDGHILVGFNHFTKLISKHNFYVISNGIEEIVNIQMFENIMDKYIAPVNNIDMGYFVFVDSIAIAPKDNWRCDNTMYGPSGFSVTEGIHETWTNSLDQLVEYEPILSADSICHILYVKYKEDEILRDYGANKLELPYCGVTISESLKLITEWAVVAEEPFNNQQPIAQAAKQFIEKFNFNTSLVDYQVDMYVSEFIKGNPNARQRPTDVQPLSPELDLFIKKNMSYRCLSALISLYSDSWDLQEVIDAEPEAFEFIHDTAINRSNILSKPLALDIFTRNVDATMKLYETIKTTGTF